MFARAGGPGDEAEWNSNKSNSKKSVYVSLNLCSYPLENCFNSVEKQTNSEKKKSNPKELWFSLGLDFEWMVIGYK